MYSIFNITKESQDTAISYISDNIYEYDIIYKLSQLNIWYSSSCLFSSPYYFAPLSP